MTPKIHVQAVIAAPLDEVWSIVGDFNSLPSWHPAISESVIEKGEPSDRIGCVRQYKRRDGLTLREQLTERDVPAHRLSYTLLDAPIPVTGYLATLRVSPAREKNKTFAEWLAWFDCAVEVEATLRESITAVFQAGFDRLDSKFVDSRE